MFITVVALKTVSAQNKPTQYVTAAGPQCGAILAGGSIRLGRIVLVLSAIECLVVAYLFLVRVPPLTSWGVGSLVAVVLSLALVGLLVARGWSWARLEPTGWTLPDPEGAPTGTDIIERYLDPLARLPQMAPHIRHFHLRQAGQRM